MRKKKCCLPSTLNCVHSTSNSYSYMTLSQAFDDSERNPVPAALLFFCTRLHSISTFCKVPSSIFISWDKDGKQRLTLSIQYCSIGNNTKYQNALCCIRVRKKISMLHAQDGSSVSWSYLMDQCCKNVTEEVSNRYLCCIHDLWWAQEMVAFSM